MRSVALIVGLAAASAAAQSTGAWGGYVGGWREPGVSTGTWTGYVGGWQSRGVTPVFRAPVLRPVPYVTAPVWFPVTTTTSANEDAEKQAAAQRAYAEAEAARQREESERRVAEERQRAAEERERAAEERARLAEERQRAAEQQRLADEALAAQRALIEHQQAELARLATPPPPPAPAPPRDETPGNEVYRWTDDDGVTHYSTRVPPEVAGKAKPVGAKPKR